MQNHLFLCDNNDRFLNIKKSWSLFPNLLFFVLLVFIFKVRSQMYFTIVACLLMIKSEGLKRVEFIDTEFYY